MVQTDIKLYAWEEAVDMNIKNIQSLYKKYVNPGQVDLIGSFGFGRVSAIKSEGIIIKTQDGREIYDFSGGIGVLNHGHNHPRILEARRKFAEQQRMEVHKNFLSQYVAALSHNIAQLLPEDLDISYYCNSGAEAVEGAIKMAYKYHGGNRKYILSADVAFHGKLLGAAGLTHSPELDFSFPTIPNIGMFQYNDIESIKEQIAQLRVADKSDIYAIVLEPFNGSSLRECSVAFLTELREICTKEDIVLIFDEVYTGWGKTGDLFNFMKKGVTPDILTFAKSFGGGKSSISGYTARTPIFMKAYGNLNDATLHSTTYNGFGEECVTAIEAINVLIEDKLIDRSQKIYEKLNPALLKLKEKYPDLIDDVRGSGALNGVLFNSEVNAVIKTALNFVPGKIFKDERFFAKLITGAVISELFNTHNILTFFGSNYEIPLIISPSLVVTDEQLDHLVDALDKTLAIGKYHLILKFAKFKYLDKS